MMDVAKAPYAIDPMLSADLALLPVLDRRMPVQSREDMARRLKGAPSGIWPELEISDHEVRVIGHPPVAVRVYRPHQITGAAPAVVWMHPGGFTLGSIEQDHERICDLAARSGRQFVSVGYRLAPEDPYPAALYDCYHVLRWLVDEGDRLRVDPERIGVAGESAGGNLAAALTLLARDRGGPAIAHQFLFGPVLDDRLDSTSAHLYLDTPVWHRTNASISWEQYLGGANPAGSEATYAAPMRATDLSGLPPAYITVSQFDPLRDEGIDYALALANANVPVDLHMYAGTFHGSVLLRGAEVSQRATAESIQAFQRAFL